MLTKYNRVLGRNRTLKGALFSLGIVLATPVSAMFCSGDANLAIPQGSGTATPGTPAVITIDVPLINAGTVTDLDFNIEIDHTYIGDLIVTLESPDGTVVTLLDRPGEPSVGSPFGCSRDNIDAVLDDEAGTLAELQCVAANPTMSGTHQPTGSLSDFDFGVIAGTWIMTVTDNAGGDLGTILSSGNCITASTTPVTLSSFKTQMRGNSLIAKWQTSSEAFNLGFHLWGKVDGNWVQLNQRLISSRSFDSVVPQNYRRKINLLKVEGEVVEVGVSSLSSAGQEEFYGPFSIGEKYGENTVPRYIDWSAQRASYNRGMLDAGYVQVKNRWVKLNPKRVKKLRQQSERFPASIVEIKKEGIVKLRYEDLLAAGIDYSGFPINKLAVTRNGKSVPRVIRGGSGKRNRFGSGSEVIFHATGPTQDEARYVDYAAYRLALDPAKVSRAPDFSISGRRRKYSNKTELVLASVASRTHYNTSHFGEKNQYSFTLIGDGWYDSAIRAFGTTASKVIELDLPASALLDQAAKLKINMIGGTNFPLRDANGDGEMNPGHHYKVYINRDEFPNPVHEGYASGVEAINIDVSVSGQLSHGSNSLELELLPDNGYNIDVAYFVDGALSVAMPNEIISRVLSFSVLDQQDVEVLDPAERVNAVYSIDADGNFAQQSFDRSRDTLRVVSTHNESLRSVASLWFLTDTGYITPSEMSLVESISDDEVDLSEVDYVVIADASLIGADLQRFVERQIELGRRTKVVSAQSIFQRYSNGAVIPHAIADYLREHAESSPFEYVLLVGGHSYNYRGYNVSEEQRPVTFIPSFYRSGEDFTKQIPTAVPFVDFNSDGAPERAIGRWPVRDLQQLKYVVDKTLTWHADGSHKDQQSALFIADRKENKNDFSLSSERLIKSLGLEYSPWPAPSTVFADDVNDDDSVDAGSKISEARRLIVNAINQGPALTVYSGHAAPTLWGNQSLVNADVADLFENSSAPSLMIPLACYTTYYETADNKALSETLLTDSPHGAVALSAASLLSRASDNEHFGSSLLEKMTVDGYDLGSAVLKVKQATHQYSPRHQGIVYNWVTLGDPTLSFALPNVRPPLEADVPKSNVP